MNDKTNSVKVDVSDMFIVTPMGQKVNLTPGESYSGEITVTNPASAVADFSFVVSITPYSMAEDSSTEYFDTNSQWSDMVDWIVLDQNSGTLKPNESLHIGFTINVPENANPGGQYAALMVGSAPSEGGADGVSINNIYEIASILYGKVAGEIKREGQILENSFPSFILELPLQTMVKVQNNGNIHETAKVTVLVKNVLTGEEIYAEKDSYNTVNDMVMPGTTKDIPRDVNDLPPLGIYEVTQSVDYMGQYSVETHNVIACPIWFIVIIVAIIAAIIGGIIVLIRRHHVKKSRLVY